MLDFVLGRGSARLTLGTATGLTFVGCLGISAITAIGLLPGELAFGAFVALVVLMSWWSAPATSVVVGLMAFLFANGFAFDTQGTLSWHGEADLVRLSLLVILALTVSVVGSRRVDHARRHRVLSSIALRSRRW